MTKHKNVALDELRILAALMVLGVHTGQKVGLGDAAAVGAQGVQLFFVLSGYLAAASLSRHPEPLPYYQRRIRRILPLYWLVLVLRWLFDAVRYLAAGTSAAQLFGPGGPCGPGYLRYFVFLQMWLPSDNWMLWNNRYVLWTMSAFAFFYLLAPWLYRLCKRFWGALALLVVCLAVKGRIGGLIESSLAAFPAEANISEFSAKTPVMTLYCFIFGMAAFAAVRENKQGVGPAENQKFAQAVEFVGAGSFWLYLAHPLVLELLPNTAMGGAAAWLCFAGVYAVCLMVCYALYTLFVRRYEQRFA